MATCSKCGKSGFGLLEVKGGRCPACRKEEERIEAFKTDEQRHEEKRAKDQVLSRSKALMISTETTINEPVERLGIVASEVVLGMNVFKDVLANVRDIFGGRSGVVQKTLHDARKMAFEEIQLQAAELGADAVIAVDIDYNSISTGSSVNMMIVSVSGTAIRRKRM
ncbi:YbjQ family protein [Celeribacter halophilus]|uniref:YbjQ family protein n=1 Tax=Celeribacter halophilus TaxID=576117 RepID=UPI003A8DB0C9